MKGNNVNNSKIYILFIVIAVVYSQVSEYIFDYIEGFKLLSTYYNSLDMTKESEGYGYIYKIYKYYFPLLITFSMVMLFHMINYYRNKKYFKDYPYIIHDYRSYHYYILSMMLLLLMSFVVLEPLLWEKFWISLIYLFISSTVIIKIGNKKYNNILKRIELIQNNNFSDSTEENITYKKYKIVPIFYIVIFIFTVTLGYKIYEFTPYIGYSSYPNELVINEDSYFSNKTWIGREEDRVFSFTSFEDLFDHYKVNKIELKIDSENSIEMLENNDYQIMIKCNLENLYLTEKDFTLVKSDNEYKYIIDLYDYDLKIEDFGILKILFFDDAKKIFVEHPIVEYNITIEKMKK